MALAEDPFGAPFVFAGDVAGDGAASDVGVGTAGDAAGLGTSTAEFEFED